MRLIYQPERLRLVSDPREFGRISASLYARTRLASGGMTQQAISAIENACIDIAAKAANVPVYALFGGPIRKEVLVYWSHCGNFRITNAAYFERVLKTAPLRSLDDVKLLGQEVAAQVIAFRGVHGRIELDQHVAGLDRLSVVHPNGAHNPGLERLDDLGAATRHDLSARRCNDVDRAPPGPY